MFDISWGETFVLFGISCAAIGRRDLPAAANFLGNKIGKVVGLLQGARARADQFAQTNELHALQNELRSGLRELDVVKSELAVAASSQGLVGRGLGTTISNSRRSMDLDSMKAAPQVVPPSNNTTSNEMSSSTQSTISGSDYLAAAKQAAENTNVHGNTVTQSVLELSPRQQSVAAVAEGEWEKRGIGFKSRAEQGTGYWSNTSAVGMSTSSNNTAIGGGSSILSDLIQQNLIHDQYDRTVMEQDQALQDRVEKAKQKAKETKKQST